MRCLILAGGFATRLWPLAKDKPKPLLKIKGKSIITHIIEKIPDELKIAVSTNKKFEKDFINWKETLTRNIELFVEDVAENGKKIGAVGALNYFIKEKKMKEDLLVVAGDNYFNSPLEDFLTCYHGKPLIGIYDTGDKDKAKDYGVIKVRNGKVIEFREKPSNPATSLISTAVYILPAKCFGYLNDFCSVRRDNLGEFIKYLVERENVMSWEFDGFWFDIGNFKSYLEAHIKTTRDVIKEKGSKVYSSSLNGSVYVGKGARVANSLVKDSIIMDGAFIEHSTVENSIIDAESIVKNSRISFDLISRGALILNGEYKR